MPKRLMTRSENMARIRSRDTKPEIQLRKALWAKGFRYKLTSDLPGRPDLVFPKERLAVFVDGCFWHGCPLHYSAPKTNQDFWKKKLRNNVLRDISVDKQLHSDGWKIIRIWQHDLKQTDQAIQKISESLESSYPEIAFPITTVAESAAPYGREADVSAPWRTCSCGSANVCVLALNGSGSLRPHSQKRPDNAELICRKCHQIFQVSF